MSYFAGSLAYRWLTRDFRPKGSLFTEETTAWNVANLPNVLNRLNLKRKVPGVNTPYLYFGMWAAAFAWHVEDVSKVLDNADISDACLCYRWTCTLSTTSTRELQSSGTQCLKEKLKTLRGTWLVSVLLLRLVGEATLTRVSTQVTSARTLSDATNSSDTNPSSSALSSSVTTLADQTSWYKSKANSSLHSRRDITLVSTVVSILRRVSSEFQIHLNQYDCMI